MYDLVFRQQVLRCIKESRKNIYWGQSEGGDEFLYYSAALYRTIASKDCLPSVQPERKKGEWERAYLDHEAIGERPSILFCSECNQCIAYPTKFCPNCGADMRGEQDG